MPTTISIDYNGFSARDGEVIRFYGPPASLAIDTARFISTHKEVISTTLVDESGKVSRFCKGEMIDAPISNAPDAPPF